MDEDIYFTVTRSPIKVPYHQDLAIIDSLAMVNGGIGLASILFNFGEDKIWLCWETYPSTIHCCRRCATN